jgi:hypothetical protein
MSAILAVGVRLPDANGEDQIEAAKPNEETQSIAESRTDAESRRAGKHVEP